VKKYAVIVAGGTGSRLGGSLPKQFQLIGGKPVLYYTINVFLNAYDDLQVILVLPEVHLQLGQEIVDAFFDHERVTLTVGGRTRFHSVQNGLALVQQEGVVMVHDGVRCLLSQQLVHRCYEAALEHGAVVPVVACHDSLRRLTAAGNEALDRETVKRVQTPQAFLSKILLPAFQIDYKERFTDEAAVVEAFGLNIHLLEGEEDNIKITWPTDLLVAEHLLNQRNQESHAS
jgi:2-C-methyl-D-erythritol 4-phosphate cytidylyltransferase